MQQQSSNLEEDRRWRFNREIGISVEKGSDNMGTRNADAMKKHRCNGETPMQWRNVDGLMGNALGYRVWFYGGKGD